MLNEILSEHHCCIDAHIKSKKAALEKLSQMLSSGLAHVDGRDILRGLSEREKLGSTILGHGVALPHARLKSINSPMGAFLKLREPVDFDGKEPVDLIFALVVPENSESTHLALLAEIARIFSEHERRTVIRSAKNRKELWHELA